MNTKQAAIVSFLSKAVKGEAEMPPHILDEFADNCRQALNKQFNDAHFQLENDYILMSDGTKRPIGYIEKRNLKHSKNEALELMTKIIKI